MTESTDIPSWESEPIFDAIVDELIGTNGNPFDIVIEAGEARIVAGRIIGRLRRLGREPVAGTNGDVDEARAISAMVLAEIITVREARELLGLPPRKQATAIKTTNRGY